jgi:hypothetical protein
VRPFFSYYGAKYTVAKYLGPPRHDLVIEPFAGSAAYSTRWNVKRARLYDVSPDIVTLWDWLIHCSTGDVERIPNTFESMDELAGLSDGARLLVQFWAAKGRYEATTALSPWYFKYRNDQNCHVWGPAVKRRVIEQKPLIAGWTVDLRSYADIEDAEAHWHVDPPYNNAAGRRYPYSAIDFVHLAEWCRSRSGHVDVCENDGATWLPFTPLCDVVSSRGRRDGHRSAEAVWRQTEAA